MATYMRGARVQIDDWPEEEWGFSCLMDGWPYQVRREKIIVISIDFFLYLTYISISVSLHPD